MADTIDPNPFHEQAMAYADEADRSEDPTRRF